MQKQVVIRLTEMKPGICYHLSETHSIMLRSKVLIDFVVKFSDLIFNMRNKIYPPNRFKNTTRVVTPQILILVTV